MYTTDCGLWRDRWRIVMDGGSSALDPSGNIWKALLEDLQSDAPVRGGTFVQDTCLKVKYRKADLQTWISTRMEEWWRMSHHLNKWNFEQNRSFSGKSSCRELCNKLSKPFDVWDILSKTESHMRHPNIPTLLVCHLGCRRLAAHSTISNCKDLSCHPSLSNWWKNIRIRKFV